MIRRCIIAACLALVVGQAARAEPHSSLPWVSGVSFPGRAFGQWRGQPVDVVVGWMAEWKGSWEQLVVSAESKSYGGEWNDAMVSMGVPMLTNDTRGRFAECAAGVFDGYVHRIATALRQKFGRPIVIRLGWEGNGTKTYPWYGGYDPAGYAACFRRQAMIFSREMPGSLIEIAHNKGKMDIARRLWPGDDVVDIIGRHGYDGDPPINSEADWQAFVGGEKGPDTWAEYARERGKPLAMAEWGVSRNGDNPLFVAKMFEWFQKNADILAYEAYFNRSEYGLYDPSSNPQSAAMYRRLWGGGGRFASSAP